MKLDDFRGLKIWCSLFCKLHHQHGTDSKVGSDDTVATREGFTKRRNVVIGKSGSAHHCMHAM